MQSNQQDGILLMSILRMTIYQGNTTTDGLFRTYYVFNKFLFAYSKAYSQISPEPEMDQALKLLTSNIPPYNLLDLNVKTAD